MHGFVHHFRINKKRQLLNQYSVFADDGFDKTQN